MARAVTQREAEILTRFGFKLAKGRNFEAIPYDRIVTIIPQDDGMEIHFNSSHPVERTVVEVMNVDIPEGKFSSDGSEKNLETAWIFVYYDKATEYLRNGKTQVL